MLQSVVRSARETCLRLLSYLTKLQIAYKIDHNLAMLVPQQNDNNSTGF